MAASRPHVLDPCDVSLVTICPRTGRVLRTVKHASSAIAFCLTEDDQKVLRVGREPRTIELPVAGGVKLHAKFAVEGRATLELTKRRVNVMLRAQGSELMSWLRSLSNPPKEHAAPPKRGLSASTPSLANRAAPRASRSPTTPSPTAPPRHKMARDPGPSPEVSKSPPAAAPSAAQSQPELTLEQQAVMETVLAGRSVFFTGGAGVGKSHLLRQIVKRLPQHTTFVTASTAMAACQVGGVTVHNFAGVGAGERPVAELAAMAMRKRGAQWRAAKTLVIDEISMLDGVFFDALEEVARRVRGSTRPFGGLQLVLCGDFFQLPPVTKDRAYRFAFEASSWGACVERTFELTAVFRQADPALVEALRQVRLGRCPAEVRELFKPCLRRALPEDDGIAATRLFTHKADCAALNEQQLDGLGGTQLTFTARDSCRDEGALATLRASCAAPVTLRLKEGTQVLLVKTIDASRGLVNGARGVVTKLLMSARSPVVRFTNGVERAMRLESFALSQGGQTVACRVQLPLALGWALSVHKSQGVSLDRVALSLGKVFECGQMYVALSRVTALGGLSLLDLDWGKLRANPRVIAWHAAQAAAGRLSQ